jgi:hypothetical protein
MSENGWKTLIVELTVTLLIVAYEAVVSILIVSTSARLSATLTFRAPRSTISGSELPPSSLKIGV